MGAKIWCQLYNANTNNKLPWVASQEAPGLTLRCDSVILTTQTLSRYLVDNYLCLHLEDLKCQPNFWSIHLQGVLGKYKSMMRNALSCHFEDSNCLPNFASNFHMGSFGNSENLKQPLNGHQSLSSLSFKIGVVVYPFGRTNSKM